MTIKKGRLSDEKRVTERCVGIPAMNAILAHLAVAIEIEFNVTVVYVTKDKGRWQLVDQHNKLIIKPCNRNGEFTANSMPSDGFKF